MHHPHIAAVLVWIAVVLAIICAIGVAIVKNAFERLHFSSTVTSFSASLIALAVWIADPVWQSKIKVTLIALVLFLMNSILSHSTARAIRIFQEGQYEPKPDENIPLITKDNPTGTRQ
jgi:monovalent cation/proton antiporter MnhG/PhaG subunit